MVILYPPSSGIIVPIELLSTIISPSAYSFSETNLKNKKGDYRKLEIGMQAEVHAITGEQSVLSWILDKIGIDL